MLTSVPKSPAARASASASLERGHRPRGPARSSSGRSRRTPGPSGPPASGAPRRPAEPLAQAQQPRRLGVDRRADHGAEQRGGDLRRRQLPRHGPRARRQSPHRGEHLIEALGIPACEVRLARTASRSRGVPAQARARDPAPAARPRAWLRASRQRAASRQAVAALGPSIAAPASPRAAAASKLAGRIGHLPALARPPRRRRCQGAAAPARAGRVEVPGDAAGAPSLRQPGASATSRCSGGRQRRPARSAHGLGHQVVAEAGAVQHLRRLQRGSSGASASRARPKAAAASAEREVVAAPRPPAAPAAAPRRTGAAAAGAATPAAWPAAAAAGPASSRPGRPSHRLFKDSSTKAGLPPTCACSACASAARSSRRASAACSGRLSSSACISRAAPAAPDRARAARPLPPTRSHQRRGGGAQFVGPARRTAAAPPPSGGCASQRADHDCSASRLGRRRTAGRPPPPAACRARGRPAGCAPPTASTRRCSSARFRPAAAPARRGRQQARRSARVTAVQHRARSARAPRPPGARASAPGSMRVARPRAPTSAGSSAARPAASSRLLPMPPGPSTTAPWPSAKAAQQRRPAPRRGPPAAAAGARPRAARAARRGRLTGGRFAGQDAAGPARWWPPRAPRRRPLRSASAGSRPRPARRAGAVAAQVEGLHAQAPGLLALAASVASTASAAASAASRSPLARRCARVGQALALAVAQRRLAPRAASQSANSGASSNSSGPSSGWPSSGATGAARRGQPQQAVAFGHQLAGRRASAAPASGAGWRAPAPRRRPATAARRCARAASGLPGAARPAARPRAPTASSAPAVDAPTPGGPCRVSGAWRVGRPVRSGHARRRAGHAPVTPPFLQCGAF